MQTAAAYIRVSTEDQLEYSPDSQIKAIRNYAEKNDMVLPDEFIFMDDGISGRNTKKRIAFTNMIAIAKTKPKPFDVILVWKFSRFARNREDSIVYKSMLRKQLGINVISISESIGDDKMAILFEAMIEAMDEYYSINLAEEVKRGMTQKATKGGILSVAPFGYKIEDDNFIQVPEEALIIKKVFNDFLNGKGMLTIAKELNAIGVRTHRGKKIENRTIEYWLNNPVYCGKIRWNPNGITSRNYNAEGLIISNGQHIPIITQEIWDKTCEKLKEYKSKNSKYTHIPSKQISHWLVGLVRCSICGSSNGNTGGVFQCGKKSKGLCSGDGYISVKKLEKIFISELENIIKNDIKDIEIVKPNDTDTDNTLAEKEVLTLNVERVKIRMKRVQEAYENGVDTLSEYKEKKDSLLKELSIAEEKLNDFTDSQKNNKDSLDVFNVKNKIINVIDTLKLPDVDNNTKNKITRSIVKEIVKTGDKADPILIIFWA